MWIKRWGWWSAALSWTVLVCLLMLTSGEKEAVAGRASGAFGGQDLTDSIGHVILFGILTGLWVGALRQNYPPRPAFRLAVALALTFGAAAEAAQRFVPERGVTLFDLFSNLLGVALAAAAIWLTDQIT